MGDQIMLNDEELNKVSGGKNAVYADYNVRVPGNEERRFITKNHLCPCCQRGLFLYESYLACKNCKILWKA